MGARTNLNFAALIGLSACAVSGVASAAGFYIQEQSAAGVGRAQAGNVAAADDASTIYFNPAGMTQLPGLQVDNGFVLLVPDASLRDTGSVDHSPLAASSPPGGGDGGNPGSATPIADFYLSAELPTDLPVWVGLGVSAPFGFAAKYAQDSFARYDSLDSFVETFDIAPTVAIKLNDWLSLGVGLDVQYAYVKLRSAVPDALAVGGPSLATDGRLTLTGHNWTTGFNGGLLIQPTPRLNIGLSYRYGITHQINGSLTVANLPGALAAANQQVPGQAALNLPDMVQAGFAYKLTPQWTVLGEFDFFTWSNFKAIDIHTNSPSLGNLVTNENYRDTFGLAVGAEYQLNDQWRLRTGFKYDETPTVDAFRDTRVPDGDRFEIAGGFHYQYDEHIGIDASYAHLFFIDSSVNVQRQFFTTVPAILTTADINAESSVSVDILSVGLSYKF
jgi:long-chain fatty acid transport protein